MEKVCRLNPDSCRGPSSTQAAGMILLLLHLSEDPFPCRTSAPNLAANQILSRNSCILFFCLIAFHTIVYLGGMGKVESDVNKMSLWSAMEMVFFSRSLFCLFWSQMLSLMQHRVPRPGRVKWPKKQKVAVSILGLLLDGSVQLKMCELKNTKRWTLAFWETTWAAGYLVRRVSYRLWQNILVNTAYM